MATEKQSDFAACWGLFWRCFVFMPAALAVFIVVGGIWFLRWFLPFTAAAQIIMGDFVVAAVLLEIWFVSIWAYRRFRLSRFFEDPPTLL